MKKRIVLFMTCLFAMIGLATAQTRVQGVVLSQEAFLKRIMSLSWVLLF